MFKMYIFAVILTYVVVFFGSLVPLLVGGKLDWELRFTADQAPFWEVRFWW